MSWQADKKEILSKLVDLYQEIDGSENRFIASQKLFDQLDFFMDSLTDHDPILQSLVQIDREFVDSYLETMSGLIGVEK